MSTATRVKTVSSSTTMKTGNRWNRTAKKTMVKMSTALKTTKTNFDYLIMDYSVLRSLKTCINNVDFTKPFADYILGRANIHCHAFHPGKDCLEFTSFKLRQ